MALARLQLGALFAVSTHLAACGSAATNPYDFGGDGGADATIDATVRATVDARREASTISLGGGDSMTTCTGLACAVTNCGAGRDTTVSGYVYAPNGLLPLYDVQVFVPNAPLDPFPVGVQCDHCGAPISGAPITTALSDATGHFTLTGVPSGSDIPIVVQLGKWRRKATIAEVVPCTANTLTDANLTRLPRTQSEGSMPHIALTTGGCDQMGCMLPKIGIDPSEFGAESDGYSKAVNVYSGAVEVGASTTADPSWTSVTHLWGQPDGSLPSAGEGNINNYDLAILSCECSEAPDTKGTVGAPTFAWMTDYLNAGGRIFTTDFQYTWYKFSPDPNLGGGSSSNPDIGIGMMKGGASPGRSPFTLATSFPKGAALAAWLENVYSGVPLPSGATFRTDAGIEGGTVTPDSMFSNIQSLAAASTITWATSPNFGTAPDSGLVGPRVFTVDTPVGQPVAKQCGRGVHLDMHVDEDGEEVENGYPTSGCAKPLTPAEAVFAFFFFDVSSCIQDEMQAPQPPPSSAK